MDVRTIDGPAGRGPTCCQLAGVECYTEKAPNAWRRVSVRPSCRARTADAGAYDRTAQPFNAANAAFKAAAFKPIWHRLSLRESEGTGMMGHCHIVCTLPLRRCCKSVKPDACYVLDAD